MTNGVFEPSLKLLVLMMMFCFVTLLLESVVFELPSFWTAVLLLPSSNDLPKYAKNAFFCLKSPLQRVDAFSLDTTASVSPFSLEIFFFFVSAKTQSSDDLFAVRPTILSTLMMITQTLLEEITAMALTFSDDNRFYCLKKDCDMTIVELCICVMGCDPTREHHNKQL